MDVSTKGRPLHEVVGMVLGNCSLQVQGYDVAIPYVAGAPGGGKTASIQGLAESNGFGLVSSHFALKPLEETGGIPQFEKITVDGKEITATEWSFPDIMKVLYLESEKVKQNANPNSNHTPMVIWLLDDIHLCSPVHMALLYELLTERKLREYHLPDNVAIVLAGNHGSNKAGAKNMFSAVINRIVLMPVYTSFTGWRDNFAIPYGVHPAIVSFLKNQEYQAFFHEEEQVETPWCSPRSWTRFSTMLKANESWDPDFSSDKCLYLAEGHVGKDAASRFLRYYDIFMKFDMANILRNVDTYELPQNQADVYALAFALTSYYVGDENRKQFMNAVAKLIIKFTESHKEMAIMILKEIINIQKILKQSDHFTLLASEIDGIVPDLTGKLIDEAFNVI